MGKKLQWICERYRGLYIHAVAFEVTEIGRDSPAPGQKWSYMVAIRSTPEPTDDLTYGPASDHSDYSPGRQPSRPPSITGNVQST